MKPRYPNAHRMTGGLRRNDRLDAELRYAHFTAIAPGAVKNVESTDVYLVIGSLHPKRFMRHEVTHRMKPAGK